MNVGTQTITESALHTRGCQAGPGDHHRIKEAVLIVGIRLRPSFCPRSRRTCSCRVTSSPTMVSVKISPAGKPEPLARSLPVTVQVKAEAKVSDVKAAIAAKFPKVSRTVFYVS